MRWIQVKRMRPVELVRIRTELGLSQIRFAKWIKVDWGTVLAWESGLRPIKDSDAENIRRRKQ